MRIWRAALLRISGLLGLRNHDRDASDEFRAHLQFHIDDNLRAGMTPDEARRDALLRFGGVGLAKEQHRDRRGMPGLDALIRDLLYRPPAQEASGLHRRRDPHPRAWHRREHGDVQPCRRDRIPAA
jgi:hypothetical protein